MPYDTAVFWARVDVQDEDACWLWGGCLDAAGYGLIKFDGKNRRAHRIAWQFAVGKIPVGMFLLHQCDVRSCCNPSHLKLGTQAENMAEMAARGRWHAVGDSHRRQLSPERKAEMKEAWYTALFWAKVEKRGPDDCWLWTAGHNDKGYGSFGFRGRVQGAHRVSYILANGPIEPSSLCVMHSCDTPLCVNPAHLSLGTRADNTRDMDRKGRRKPGGVKGERHHNIKLSEAQVAAIRAAYVPGVVRLKDLADQYGVSLSHTCEIVNRKVRM